MWSFGDHIKTRKARNLCPRKIFIPLLTQMPFFTFLPTMTTPLNTSPTAVAHRDAVISAFNNYKYSRDSKDPSDMLFLLSLAAKYCMCVSYTSYLFLFSRNIDAQARGISSTQRILSYSCINQCTTFFSLSGMSTTPLLKQHLAWSLNILRESLTISSWTRMQVISDYFIQEFLQIISLPYRLQHTWYIL